VSRKRGGRGDDFHWVGIGEERRKEVKEGGGLNFFYQEGKRASNRTKPAKSGGKKGLVEGDVAQFLAKKEKGPSSFWVAERGKEGKRKKYTCKRGRCAQADPAMRKRREKKGCVVNRTPPREKRKG